MLNLVSPRKLLQNNNSHPFHSQKSRFRLWKQIYIFVRIEMYINIHINIGGGREIPRAHIFWVLFLKETKKNCNSFLYHHSSQ